MPRTGVYTIYNPRKKKYTKHEVVIASYFRVFINIVFLSKNKNKRSQKKTDFSKGAWLKWNG